MMQTEADLLLLSERTGIKPKVLREIEDLAERCGIRTVLLFGSRARGDHREKSDIDLAVTGGDASLFRLEVEDHTSTLLRFDVVNLDTAVDPGLLANIRREGILLYEKV